MEGYEKSGKYFIAYKGCDYSSNEIMSALQNICPDYYEVNYEIINDDLIFAKIVYDEYIEDRDPYYDDEGVLTVNGYIQEEISNANQKFSQYYIDDSDRLQRLTNYLYRDVKSDMFKKLSPYMHFCSVIWDKHIDDIIAGVTEPKGKYTHLYYGFTKVSHELMFSNNQDILENFCDEIMEMPNNTFMKNGEIYNLNGKKYIEKNPPLIKKSRQNADSLIDALNTLLVQITNEAIRDKTSQNIDKYLSSNDPKKRINDYVLKELGTETKKQILEIIKSTIQDYSIEHSVSEQLYELFDKKLNEYADKTSVPIIHIIKSNDTILGQTSEGFCHEKFEQILTQVQLDEPIMLIGPAGSGKNVAVSQVAQALGQHMYYTNNASNEFKLTGFIDAGGHYRDTEFYKAFKNGGVFFLDEIDNSDPSALIVINSALANGYMAFPHETIDRHPNFRIVAAANTWGKGADLQYVGRNALDASTLDRFDSIFFDYDTKLEKALYPNDEVLQFMWSFRNAVYQSKIPHIVSTRGIGKVYKKEINGIPVEDILTSNIVKNLGQDDVNTIIGNMTDVSSENKYFEGIKHLRLRR